MNSFTLSVAFAIPKAAIETPMASANGITSGAAKIIINNTFFQFEVMNPLLNLLDAPRTLLV